jgi:hypothetical protein
LQHISFPHLEHNGLLWSHASVYTVPQKTIVLLVGNRESGIEFLSEELEGLFVYTIISKYLHNPRDYNLLLFS